MAELPQDGDRSNQLKQLNQLLGQCVAFDVDALVRSAQGLPNGFDMNRAIRELLPCLELCRAIADHEVEELRAVPGGVFGPLQGAVAHTINTLQRLADFRLSGVGNDQNNFNQIAQQLPNSTPSWFQALLQALTFLRRKDVDYRKGALELEAQREGIEDLRAKVENELKAIQTEGWDKLKAADEALKAAKQAALLEGVTKQGREFRFARRGHEKEANRWAIGAAGVGLLIAAGCLWVYACPQSPPLPDKSWMVAANLSYFGVRVLLVSVLSFVMVVCVRNYRGARHNEVMNAHRARALATFRNFTEGSEPAVRQAVTLQAAQAVFAVQPSAYAEPSPVGSTHFAELLAAAKETK